MCSTVYVNAVNLTDKICLYSGTSLLSNVNSISLSETDVNSEMTILMGQPVTLLYIKITCYDLNF